MDVSSTHPRGYREGEYEIGKMLSSIVPNVWWGCFLILLADWSHFICGIFRLVARSIQNGHFVYSIPLLCMWRSMYPLWTKLFHWIWKYIVPRSNGIHWIQSPFRGRMVIPMHYPTVLLYIRTSPGKSVPSMRRDAGYLSSRNCVITLISKSQRVSPPNIIRHWLGR